MTQIVNNVTHLINCSSICKQQKQPSGTIDHNSIYVYMSPVVHSPLCSMFHLIKNQNKLNSFLSHLYCFYFDRNIETLLLFEEFETWNEAFLCWYGIKDNHRQSTSFLRDLLPSTGTYFTHHQTPRVHQLFFVSSIGVNLDFLKTFWKVDV